MDFQLQTLTLAGASSFACDALLVLVPEAYKGGKDKLSAWVHQALQAGDLDTKPGKTLQAYRVDGIKARRVVLAGIGKGTARQVQQAVTAAVAALKGGPVAHLAVVWAEGAVAPTLRVAMQAVADASYQYTSTKSKPEPVKLTQVTLAVSATELASAPLQQAFAQGVAVLEGVALAKEWANRPGNHATPSLLADAALALGKLPGIKTEVLGLKEVAKLGMGAFMAVAQGSEQPLKFIVLRYDGAKRTPSVEQSPVVLVGKGITFDTGSISIKPAAEMDEMKFDMGGAASVLGVFRALAHFKPQVNVVGLIPSCENMPDGKAVKPGDVVTSMSGQTIEILNTDAEGRLILCDALTYAARFKPRAVVDIATLTGACVIALGAVRSGLFATDDALAQALYQAGESALDPCWRMPLDEEYGEGLKSNFADMGNVAGRAGGAITAAKFLQRFVGELPWAHLDIAGTAWKSGAAKGATGRPVGLLFDFLCQQVSPAAAQPASRSRKRKA